MPTQRSSAAGWGPLSTCAIAPTAYSTAATRQAGCLRRRSWSASTSSSRPTTTDTTCPATGSQNGSRTPSRWSSRSIRVCTTGSDGEQLQEPRDAASARRGRGRRSGRPRPRVAGSCPRTLTCRAARRPTRRRAWPASGVGLSSGRGAPPGPPSGGVNSGRSIGNRITSRIGPRSASSITSRSMPTPSPPAGGMPVPQRADVVLVDVAIASSSPRCLGARLGPRTRLAARPGRSARCRRCPAPSRRRSARSARRRPGRRGARGPAGTPRAGSRCTKTGPTSSCSTFSS